MHITILGWRCPASSILGLMQKFLLGSPVESVLTRVP